MWATVFIRKERHRTSHEASGDTRIRRCKSETDSFGGARMSVIQLEKQGSIAILTLSRPDMMNALGQEGDGAAVAAACAEIEDDPSIRCAILTGATKHNSTNKAARN